jgi:hypothetical protein
VPITWKKYVKSVVFNTVAMVTKILIFYYVQSVTWFIVILFMDNKQRVKYCISWSCHICSPSFLYIFWQKKAVSQPRWFHKKCWFSLTISRCPKKFGSVYSKLNKVHENHHNSFWPKIAFWTIFPREYHK